MSVNSIISEEQWGIPVITHLRLNSVNMLFEQDLAESIFNEEEFAISAIITYPDGFSHKVSIIFDEEAVEVDPDTGATVLSADPLVTMQASKYKRQYDRGCSIKIKGQNYFCLKPQPDGAGILMLKLQRQKTI